MTFPNTQHHTMLWKLTNGPRQLKRLAIWAYGLTIVLVKGMCKFVSLLYHDGYTNNFLLISAFSYIIYRRKYKLNKGTKERKPTQREYRNIYSQSYKPNDTNTCKVKSRFAVTIYQHCLHGLVSTPNRHKCCPMIWYQNTYLSTICALGCPLGKCCINAQLNFF